MSASRERKLRQAQADAPQTEREKQEVKQAKKLKLQTTVFVVVCVLMLAVLVGYGIVNTGVVERSTTALTVGEHKISAAEMNYFFVNEAYNYYNQNQQFVGYFISPNTPLDKQVVDSETGYTWADQFMDLAVTNARDTYAIYDLATAEGFTLSEADLAQIDSTISSLDVYATLAKASSPNAYLRSFYGRGCNTDNYRHYLTVQQTAKAYASQHRDSIAYTDADLADYEAKDPQKYNCYDFRHYFISIPDYYPNDDPSDEEKEVAQQSALKAAQELADASRGDEDAFIEKVNALEAAKSKGDDATSESEKEYDAATATLYKNTSRDSVNTTLVDWITDAAREPGDCDVVPAVSTAEGKEGEVVGYYVALYLDRTDNTDLFTKDVRHILISGVSEESKAKAEELLASFEENPTEENFAALADENTADTGSKGKGGLYEAVEPGQMVETFNDWCFNEDHKPGDYGMIESDYGYHLMYMVGDNMNYRQAMIIDDFKSDNYSDWYTSVTEAVTEARHSGMSWVHTGIYLGTSNS